MSVNLSCRITQQHNSNMADEDFDMDPAIAEAMGFSGFGAQPKKRKFNDNDAFVDPNLKPEQVKGANNVPLGVRSSKPATGNDVQGDDAEIRATDPGPAVTSSKVAVRSSGPPTLEALKHGVRNEQGDMAYFLPSFIEDPWKGLQPQ